ncbi:hypothetical protein IQ254_15050 [Nodosilinea sp. LEGE 07088]|uniref:hypothetical protein n=1 Tax=Nodosilinea sp. LEGE 07088 TaxID=2777968 RepID=UPI001880A219|nr:hypothetical protein [Nodosilinea sp. LEGE 07088]MBE9138491.1 hypothetical protein [Nodosilinea sp. LEGE 07088]
MMGSPTHEPNDHHNNLSDLTQIRGIGVVRKRWLNSLGIHTITDLAQASASGIEAQAKLDGRTMSPDELKDWIAQAQVRHAEASLEQPESSRGNDAIASVSDLPQRVQERTDAADISDLSPWESFASFKVDCQIRRVNGQTEKRFVAHHLETDETESWDSAETGLMQQWLRDRIEAALSSLPAADPAMSTPIEAEITRLRVLQPDHMSLPLVADKNIPIFSEALHTTDPFALEVSMQFPGLAEAYPGKQVAYHVQCFARNLATGITDSLGEVTAQVCASNDSVYNVLLPSLRLLQAGSYRLKVLATLQQAPAASGRFKVPLLQVI